MNTNLVNLPPDAYERVCAPLKWGKLTDQNVFLNVFSLGEKNVLEGKDKRS